MRVHITGASGSGTTTLGAALAVQTDARHLDTDDFYWQATDPPYQVKRDVEARRVLLRAEIEPLESWVISGSLCGWGDAFIPLFDFVVFLWLPVELRIRRLRAREMERFGAQALAPGGLMHDEHEAFIDWAASYDEAGPSHRSQALHQAWLAQLPCRVLRLEGDMTVAARLARVLREVSAG